MDHKAGTFTPAFWKREAAFSWREHCVSQDGKETEDTVETRDGVPTSTSRVDSCVHFFSAIRHNTTMFTDSQEQLRKREAPSIRWYFHHPLPCRKALRRLTSLALGRITPKIPLSPSVLLLAVMTTDETQVMKRLKLQSCFSGRTQTSPLMINGAQAGGRHRMRGS